MEEKEKKASKHKIKKKLLNSFLIIWHFLTFINIVLHTQKFIVTYTPTVTSTDRLLLAILLLMGFDLVLFCNKDVEIQCKVRF